MENLDYKQNIISTRLGGFGSSDAKMFVRLGKLILTGETAPILNDTEKERISVMLGLAERKQFTTKATRLGDTLENQIFAVIKGVYPDAVSNPYFESTQTDYGFRVSCHIDYEVILPDELVWIENKASKFPTAKVFGDYEPQLAWEHMLLKERAQALGKKKYKLFLSHYQTEQTEEFDIRCYSLTEVLCPTHVIEQIIAGLQYIDKVIPTYKKEDKDCLYAENLPMETQQQIDAMAAKILEMKRIEADIEAFKTNMCALMQEAGVKSVKHAQFSITLVPESQTAKFDSSRFKKEHKDLYEQYQTVVNKKSFVTIKTA